jgi:hypothetical protein
MAKIWAVYEGREPTIGGPWARLPLLEAIDLLELRPDDHVSELELTPRFGDLESDGTYAGFKHIVVEAGTSEARKAKWKPGFYISRIAPRDAIRKLIQQALATELGKENVLRVEYEPTTDSLDRESLKITVVIAPDAVENLDGRTMVNASIKLQERFHHMREKRTPMLEFVTEAELELEKDAGPQS